MKQWINRLFCSWILIGFLLGVRGGYLVLLKEGSTVPVRVFPCPVSCLPQADQQALTAGIPVRTPEALAGLLEDFLS